jgi:uncharacterized membrane protein
MIVLIVLLASFGLYRLLGVAGVAALDSALISGRAALATMFFFTAASHFTATKNDLIAMVPPALPRPDLLVLTTGIAEFTGAVGLLVASTAPVAAIALSVLMAAMLPANISAARRGVLLRGRKATALWLRIPMQVLFISWALMVR